MSMHRRSFLRLTASTAGFLGVRRALRAGPDAEVLPGADGPFGAVVPDPDGLFDLPASFQYRIISEVGDEMADGLVVPALPDGMGAFPGPGGTVLLVRNHENDHLFSTGAFGPGNQRIGSFPRSYLYDDGELLEPSLGGTTTIVYDPASPDRVRQSLSLAGTNRNCGGGVTPWGTWLTCEENLTRAGEGHARRDHGWVFEVQVSATIGPNFPRPLRGLGRFLHEAAVVDPETGVVYLTEDQIDSCLYRFVPDTYGNLTAGVLQALVVLDAPEGVDLRNNQPDTPRFAEGTRLPVSWVTIRDPEALISPTSHQGRFGGAAVFARGEGAWFGNGALYFVCTNGGRKSRGQIWKLTPASNPRIGIDEDGIAGWLTLFVEPNNTSLFDMGDALCVTPWGDVFVCEDGTTRSDIIGIQPDGRLYEFGRNAAGHDFTGLCFSPDGTTMFVNDYGLGCTYAVTRRP
jgi:secreted PhoX family phosphatase